MNPGQIEAEEKQRIDEIKKAAEQVRQIEQRVIKNLLGTPAAAEQETPRPAETSPGEAYQLAEQDKNTGSVIPLSTLRPQPNKAIREEGSVIIAKRLAEQLGTSPELKAMMRIDERKMAVLQDATLAALSHFSYRFVYDKVRYWGHIVEWWLTGSQGIGGLGRRHILQAIANASGVQSIDKAKTPNAISRNIFNRDWREKAEREGKLIEE